MAMMKRSALATAFVDLVALLLAGACGSALPADTAATAFTPAADEIPLAPARPPAPAQPALLAKTAALPKAPCPREMAHVADAGRDFCVDRWEASLVRVGAPGHATSWPDNQPVDGVEDQVMAVSRPNVLPQGYINEVQSAHACARAGKRLCKLDEWRAACGGTEHRQYPYGKTRHTRTCNDYDGGHPHPVMQLFNQVAAPGTPRSDMWNTTWMNDPRLHEAERGLLPTGASSNCTNDYGVYDMVGNLHEWVDDSTGSFAGGFFMDTRINGEGCAYLTTAHAVTYHDYSTGFRCCADANP
jgi:hypothetical protein